MGFAYFCMSNAQHENFLLLLPYIIKHEQNKHLKSVILFPFPSLFLLFCVKHEAKAEKGLVGYVDDVCEHKSPRDGQLLQNYFSSFSKLNL